MKIAGVEIPGKNPAAAYDQLKAAAASARRPHEKDWYLNMAFYFGEHYVEWAGDVGVEQIRRVPRADNQKNYPRPVVNKIMHFANQQHAFALQTKPSMDVLPATDDPSDISFAQVALAYIEHVTSPQVGNFERVLSHATMWAVVAGECYIKWFWNAYEKRPDFIVVSPVEMYADPYATEFRKARWVIHEQFMDVEQVYDQFEKEVKPNQVEKADMFRTQLLREMGQAATTAGVTVNELWHKPSRRHPQGLYVVWAGDQILARGPLPYDHGQIPFSQIGMIQRPGSQHYMAAVKFLRSPQMELDKFHAQVLVIRENFGSPKWFLDSALNLEKEPTDAPNEILRGDSLGGSIKPEIIQPAAMASREDGQWITEEMMNVVGMHEVSQAQVPGRVESSKAIELLKEADTTRLAELLATTQNLISEGGWQLLMLAKQYETPEKVLASYSREGMPEVKHFLKHKVDKGMVVRVAMQTGLATSRAARHDELNTLWTNQVIRDPEQMAEMLDLPLPRFVSAKAFDIRLARNENFEMAKGTAIKPNSWDLHSIHIREHNSFRKTHEYLLMSSDAKRKIEFHVDTHEQMEMQELEKNAYRQAVMQGMTLQAQGQPGAPTQPAPAGGVEASDAQAETEPPEQAPPQPQGGGQTDTAAQVEGGVMAHE